jgi:hypothetical protein
MISLGYSRRRNDTARASLHIRDRHVEMDSPDPRPSPVQHERDLSGFCADLIALFPKEVARNNAVVHAIPVSVPNRHVAINKIAVANAIAAGPLAIGPGD